MNSSVQEPVYGSIDSFCIHQIEEHVRRDLRGRLSHFHLVTDGDGIVLHGETASYHVKQLALHVVMQATTLPIRGNQIVVSRS